MARKLLLLNGPNLNLLGTREPAVYGSTTLADIEGCRTRKPPPPAQLISFQSNHEGALIDRIHAARAEKSMRS
jgi:3-dehydroquinate dehydratase-2